MHIQYRQILKVCISNTLSEDMDAADPSTKKAACDGCLSAWEGMGRDPTDLGTILCFMLASCVTLAMSLYLRASFLGCERLQKVAHTLEADGLMVTWLDLT